MEGLGFDNIWGEQDLENLFTGSDESDENGQEESPNEKQAPEDQEKHNDTETTEVDPDNLFEEEEKKEKPESVGSEEHKEVKEKEGSSAENSGGTSPENFYSSIADAVAEDGVFPNLDEETIKKAVDAESFSKLFDLEVEARLDDAQKRIKRALENNVEPDSIRFYEGTLQRLASIKEADIIAEDERAEKLRYQLITQDFLNKGLSEDKAVKMAKRSIDAGTDVEDAKEALQSNKDFFQGKYEGMLKEAEQKAEEDRAERRKQEDKLKESILKDKTLMGDMEISGDLRRKVLENISRPVYKDPDTGEYMTALQKYEMENRADFLKYAGLFYTLTNGFKDFESFTKGKVQKELKKGLSQLEKTLNSTRRDSSGKLELQTSARIDQESYIGKGWKLDI